MSIAQTTRFWRAKWVRGPFCPSQCPSKIKGAARQRYGDDDGVARCERDLITLLLAASSVHNKQKLFSHINFNISVVNYFPCYEHKSRVSARDLLKYATMNTFFFCLKIPCS